MRSLSLTARDALLVVAPHPDDELIATGLLIQGALAAGARVHVVIATSGDAFGYAGPPLIRKSLAGRRAEALTRAQARRRLGVTRQNESLSALKQIGLPQEHVTFLGYPDRGLHALWHRHWVKPFQSPFTLTARSPYTVSKTLGAAYTGERLLADLKEVIRAFRPTLCVYPHPRDNHRDHSSLSAFVTCALEEVAAESGDRPLRCRRFLYFVHLGGWPTPRSAPAVAFQPAARPELKHEAWVEVVGTRDQIEAKRRAVAMYRSQTPLLGRFLAGFVRRNELFVEGAPLRVRSRELGDLFVGAKAEETTRGEPLLPLPPGNRLSAQMGKAADISSVDVISDGATVVARLNLSGKPAPEVEYRIQLWNCPRSKAVTIRCKPPDRVVAIDEKGRRCEREVVVKYVGRRVEVSWPAALLATRHFFLAASTKARGLILDASSVHFLRLPVVRSGDPPVVYTHAAMPDLAACASIFEEAFAPSLQHIFGNMPPRRLIEQVFRLFYDAEPDALMVALSRGRVVGYVYAPTSLRKVWRAAFHEGHVLRWLTAWVKGKLSIGTAPIRVLLANKFHFLRSAFRHEIAADARILSIAVAQGARGRGIGGQLVKHALARFHRLGITKVRLEVRPENQPAIKAYRRHGFVEVGTSRDSQGEWLIMLRDTEPDASSP